MKNNAVISSGMRNAFVYDIFCTETNIAISKTAINGGSDQAIEYCHNNAGLKATNAVVAFMSACSVSARFDSAYVTITTMKAQVAFRSNKNKFALNPTEIPIAISAESPGGRTVIGNPVTSSKPRPFAMLVPTAT